MTNRFLRQAGLYVKKTESGYRLKKLSVFRLDEKAFDYLSPEMKKLVGWGYGDKSNVTNLQRNSRIAKIWGDIPEGHKWLAYFDIYEKLFSDFVGRSPNVLEIGVYRGGSSKMWVQYFGEGTKFLGIDINPDCKKFENIESGIRIEIGSQADPEFLKRIVSEYGPFDLILDDGSHVCSHQITSFNNLFMEGLKQGGIYMVEDLETNYYDDPGFRDWPLSFVEFSKMIVDLMNYPFIENRYYNFRSDSEKWNDEFVVPEIARHLNEVRFFTSIIAFYKQEKLPPVGHHL